MLITLVLLMFSACGDDEKGSSSVDVPHSSAMPITLTDILPAKGGLGTRVVITGKNFGNDKSKVKVLFNEKEALIFNINNRTIYAMVPKQPGDLSTIKVVIDDKEGALEEKQFAYQIRAVVTTVAGTGEVGDEDGALLEATFGRVVMLDVDDEGNILVSDAGNGHNKVRLVSLRDKKVMTIATGTGYLWQSAFSADYKNFYVIERGGLIRGYNRDANWAEEKFYDVDNLLGSPVYGITTDHEKSIYAMSSTGRRIVKIDQETKKMELIGQDLGLEAWVHIEYNRVDHYIYITTESNRTIYRVNTKDLPITRAKMEIYAGSPSAGHDYKDGYRLDARFGSMEGICCDREGNIYVADYGNNVIRKIDPNGNVTTVAGVPGKSGYKDGKPHEALFNYPIDVAVDPDGILYVADENNKRVRCIAIQ